MPKRTRSIPNQSAEDHQPVPLLEPKLYPPRLHASLIERKRLLEKLDAIQEHTLTLLCAPAGFGKTTAINQWMERCAARDQALPVAWIALEDSDNDSLRFWRYVLTACRVFQAGVGQAALAQISAELPPFAMPSLELLLTLLLNDITRMTSSGLLILDDYHIITDPHIHETLTFFLDHLPAHFHVVILTRGIPLLPLARWRARGDLCEIQTADLRFSREEMTNFLGQMLALAPSSISPETLGQLESRLEGWAAGLRLLALAFQGKAHQQNIEQFLTTFVVAQRSLQDYFSLEVLNAQSESRQNFLLRTSVLNRLTGPLCDAVAEGHDSAHLLEEIEQAGIFLELLDHSGQWYRYHALFAEAMQAEARRRLGNDALLTLALNASQWYEEQGMFAEAIETAFQSQDIPRAAALIEAMLRRIKHFILGPQVFQEINGFHTLRRWLEQLPQMAFRGHPLLSLGYATALLFVFVVDQQPSAQVLAAKTKDHYPSYGIFLRKIEEALQAAVEDFRAVGDNYRFGGALAFHALIAREQGKNREAISYASEALAWLPEDDQEWRNLGLNVIGMGKLIDGQLGEAQKIFLELCALCETFGNRAILRANNALLNIIFYEQGKMHQTAVFFQQMHSEAREESDYDDIAHSSLILAWLSYEWNDLLAAEQQALETLKLGQQIGNEEFQVLAALVLARIEYARGERAQARQRCTILLARLPAISPLRARLCREIELMQAIFALASGDLSAVERWRYSNPPVQEQELPLSLRVREELLVARWLLAQGRGAETLDMLTRLHDEAQHMGRARSALEIQVVLLLAQHSCGKTQAASQTLQVLLACAHTEGYIRLFLDEDEMLITLLRVAIPQLREHSLIMYVQTLLRAAAAIHGPSPNASLPAYALLAEPLSSQEQRVLRLLMAGYTNPQIARDLVVSVNTVKVHLKNIYRKLNVTSRLAACEAARHLDFS